MRGEQDLNCLINRGQQGRLLQQRQNVCADVSFENKVFYFKISQSDCNSFNRSKAKELSCTAYTGRKEKSFVDLLFSLLQKKSLLNSSLQGLRAFKVDVSLPKNEVSQRHSDLYTQKTECFRTSSSVEMCLNAQCNK